MANHKSAEKRARQTKNNLKLIWMVGWKKRNGGFQKHVAQAICILILLILIIGI